MQTLIVETSILARVADRLDEIAGLRPVPAQGILDCLAELEQAWSGSAAEAAFARLRDLAGALAQPDLDLLPALERDRLSRARYPGGLPYLDRSDALLLRYDEAGDGRLIVAFGNPDTARHVATYVPGAGSALSGIGGELERAAALKDRAGPDSSVIMWLGYDAPDFADAVLLKAAREGAASLARFQAGLASNHDGGPVQRTVIGHSYGSVVIGLAARDSGFAADDLVALGSPGMGVPSASQLSGQVWASTAANDPIRLVPDFVLGRDPDHNRFGARVFDSAPMGHSGYFHPGNPALDALARIVTTGKLA